MDVQLIWLGRAAAHRERCPNVIFLAGKLPQLGEEVGKAGKGFKKLVHDAEEEAVQPSANPLMTVAEIIQNKWCMIGKPISASTVKDMVGGEVGQNLSCPN
jgi:hypothetical protein